jgi:hypothetical protein
MGGYLIVSYQSSHKTSRQSSHVYEEADHFVHRVKDERVAPCNDRTSNGTCKSALTLEAQTKRKSRQLTHGEEV